MIIQISFYDETDFIGIEVGQLFFLCLFAQIASHIIDIDIHLVIIRLQDTTLIEIGSDGVTHPHQLVVGILFLQVAGQLLTDKRYLALILLLIL